MLGGRYTVLEKIQPYVVTYSTCFWNEKYLVFKALILYYFVY